MKAAPVVALMDNVEDQFLHVTDALAHAAAELNQSVASVRMESHARDENIATCRLYPRPKPLP